MSASLSRTIIGRPQLRFLTAARTAVRNASTTTQASNAASKVVSKASNAASQTTSQASQGLSRVQETAGNAASRASSAAGNAIGTLGNTTGRIVNFAQSLVPPTLYYGKVGIELGKLVAHNRKMSPPDVATFQTYFQNMISSFRTTSLSQASSAAQSTAQSMSPQSIIKRIQSMDNQQMISVGVVAAEAIGFFTVGEMIGRMKLIGYSSSQHGHGATNH